MSSANFKDLIKAQETQEESTNTKVPEEDLKPVTVTPDIINEAFETTPTSLAPTDTEKKILEHLVSGYGIAQIAIKLGVAETVIRTYVRNREVKEYIKEVKEALNEIDQMMLTSTLRKIVGARIEELEDSGESFAKLTKKDTLDVIKTFSDITNQITKAQVDEKSDDVFVQIYQQILEK